MVFRCYGFEKSYFFLFISYNGCIDCVVEGGITFSGDTQRLFEIKDIALNCPFSPGD